MEITRNIAAKVLKVVDAGLSSGIGVAEPGKMCVEAAACFALGEPHGDAPSCVAPALRSLKIQLNDANWSSNQARAKGLRRLALAQLGSKGALDEKEFVRRIVDYALRVSVSAALLAAASVCKDKAHREKLIAAVAKCEAEGTREAAVYAADAAANAVYAYDADAAAYAVYAANAAAAYAANAATAYDAYAYDADAAANAVYAAYAAAYAANAYDADAAATYAAARDKSLAAYAEAVVQILIDMKAPGCRWLDLAPLEAAS